MIMAIGGPMGVASGILEIVKAAGYAAWVIAIDEAETKVTPEIIEAKVDEITKGFGGDVGIVPRQFLRSLVNRFDVVAENPEAELPDLPKTPVEERAAEGKKPVEHEPEPDDQKGYAVAATVEL